MTMFPPYTAGTYKMPVLAPVCGSILWTGLGDLPMPAGVPPKGGVKARIGFPINMAGLG